jgi:DNA-binding MarR family transcriptional regulator
LDIPRELRIGALVRISHQESNKVIKQRLVESGYDDVRTSFTAVIQPLGFNPTGLSITELAQLSGMTTQSMGELVQQLIKGGYVELEQSQQDRRTKMVKLSPKGKELSSFMYTISGDIEREWAFILGHERFQNFKETLFELITSLNQLNRLT